MEANRRIPSIDGAPPKHLCFAVLLTLLMLLAAPRPNLADVAWADSNTLTVDALGSAGSLAYGDSSVFVVDASYTDDSVGFGDSNVLLVNQTRIARGYADSNIFGVNLPETAIISGLDRWWAYAGTSPAGPFILSIVVGMETDYELDLDFEGLGGGWDLASGAYATVDHGPTQYEFGVFHDVQLGTLSLGEHTIEIYRLLPPPDPIIERIRLQLKETSGDLLDTFNAVFIADRVGLTDVDVAALSFDDGNGQPLPEINTIQALVDAFAPRLYFDSDENYFPQSVETTLALYDPGCGEGVVVEDADDVFINDVDGPQDLLEIAQQNGSDEDLDDLWLDLPCEAPLPLGEVVGDDNFPLYATAIQDGDTIAISYLIHYGYSNWRQHEGYNNHEGDWEGGFVYLERSGIGGSFIPVEVAYSQHEKLLDYAARGQASGGQWALWSDLRGAGLVEGGTHPRLYVGLGGHASYFAPYDYIYDALPCPIDGHLGVHTERCDGNSARAPRQSEDVVLLPRVGTISANSSWAWLVFPGHWGQQSLYDNPLCFDWLEGDEGPLGPVFTKPTQGGETGSRWFDPIGWPNQGPFNFGQFVPPSVDCWHSADCDDGNPCTDDTCQDGSCVNSFLADGTSCSDGEYCNGLETCLAGACVPGAPVDCSYLTDECSTGSCNEVSDLCEAVPLASGTPCGDRGSSACDSPDTCDGSGSCLANHAPNGSACPDDGNECSYDECLDGACIHPDEPLGMPCGDQSTSDCDAPDSCDGSGACLDNHLPDGTPCSDDGWECTYDECSAGACLHPDKPAGIDCEDGSFCTLGDRCDGAGRCVGGAEDPCGPGEGCDELNDLCVACLCGDLDGDGEVNLADFVTFAQCFGLSIPAGDCDAEELFCSDLDGDGEVNLADFVTFAQVFGQSSTSSPPNCP